LDKHAANVATTFDLHKRLPSFFAEHELNTLALLSFIFAIIGIFFAGIILGIAAIVKGL
jgi:hypothetical protein